MKLRKGVQSPSLTIGNDSPLTSFGFVPPVVDQLTVSRWMTPSNLEQNQVEHFLVHFLRSDHSFQLSNNEQFFPTSTVAFQLHFHFSTSVQNFEVYLFEFCFDFSKLKLSNLLFFSIALGTEHMICDLSLNQQKITMNFLCLQMTFCNT